MKHGNKAFVQYCCERQSARAGCARPGRSNFRDRTGFELPNGRQYQTLLRPGRAHSGSDLYLREQVAAQHDQERGDHREHGKIGGQSEVRGAIESIAQAVHAVGQRIQAGQDG
jgi:hypothetical protein